MFLKLLGILFAAIATLGGAFFLGVVLLLVLRFWFVAIVIAIFLCILYTLSRIVGLEIRFYPW
jgi:hypothetical protein